MVSTVNPWNNVVKNGEYKRSLIRKFVIRKHSRKNIISNTIILICNSREKKGTINKENENVREFFILFPVQQQH